MRVLAAQKPRRSRLVLPWKGSTNQANPTLADAFLARPATHAESHVGASERQAADVTCNLRSLLAKAVLGEVGPGGEARLLGWHADWKLTQQVGGLRVSHLMLAID